MKRATLWAVYCGSFAVHALLGVAMAEPEPEPPPPPPEPKEEPPPEEEPELETEAEPPEPEPKPKVKPAPKPDAGAKPAKGPDVPFYGGHFEGGAGPGGLAVPQPNEGHDEEPERKPVIQKHRDLSKKPKLGNQRTCGEPVVKPKPIEIPQPAYPEKARAAGLEGKVRLKVTVGVDGRPSQIAVLASLDPELDQAARKAMKEARFEPGTACGKAVSTSVTISIKFSK
jgi:protein TonB